MLRAATECELIQLHKISADLLIDEDKIKKRRARFFRLQKHFKVL